MPSDPSSAWSRTESTCWSSAMRSGVITRRVRVAMSAGLHLLGLLDRLVDRADVHERALGQVVVLALDDLLEAAHGLGARDEHARRAGELLGHEERLREEALDAARAHDDALVVVGELLDAQDRDDVLQVGVALQDPLRLARDLVVL